MAFITDEQIFSRNNRFDQLRLAAAYLVIISHSWNLFGRPNEIFRSLTGYATGGDIAVSVFFVISGFLIYGSAVSSKTLARFLAARAVRLFPGAFVCAVFCALGVGLAYTSLDSLSYLTSWRPYRFIIENSLLFSIQYDLPGVFQDNIHKGGVNVSLWTLPIEIKAYLICAAIYFGLRSRLAVFAAAIICFVAVSVENPVLFFAKPDTQFYFWEYAFYFFVGSTLFILRHRLVLSGWIPLVLGALYVAAWKTPFAPMLCKAFLPYTVLYLAFCLPKLRFAGILPDISYGVYIYGWVVQQMVSNQFARSQSFEFCVVLSLLIATLLGLASWYLVEGPALGRKKQIAQAFETWLDPQLARVAHLRREIIAGAKLRLGGGKDPGGP
jgi:peptidoglycan/LPS O-acetylase OafA/YrhL